IDLEPMSVAAFHETFLGRLADLDLATEIWDMPVEIPGAIPFSADHGHASYDGDAVKGFWRGLVEIDRILTEFRSRFVGKASPVHLFW
ncbi:DUF5996 family protein, partial [Klebsiella pneumoniae]